MKLNSHIDAVAIIDANNELHIHGSSQGKYPLASLTKILTMYCVVDTAASGFIDLDQRFGLTEISFVDLLSHASGISAKGDEPIEPRTKRIYTNEAYKRIEEEIQYQLGHDFPGISIETLFEEGIKPQLDVSIEMGSDPAAGAKGSFEDLIKLISEMREPKLIEDELHQKATTPYLEDLAGIVPGWGHFNKNTWGLGYEIHGEKNHWMGKELSPQSYGHFGLSGAYVVHDPVRNVSIAQIANQDFGPWAKDVWPALNDKIVKDYS